MDGSPASAWRLFIDEWILKHIKKCTEDEAHRHIPENKWVVTLEEVDAFIAILYARGIYCAKGLELDSLWSMDWGPPFFRNTMPRDRFREIMRFLRFDIKSTRSDRLQTDKFALVSDVWNRFIENCKTNYTPGPNLTVDEQLFPTKARCRFIQYMPNKPDKFGIKFWLAADVDSKYLINGFPYLGKDHQCPPNVPLSEYVVLRLISPYENKGRNVTTDNFFTTLKLAEALKSKYTSLVGTVKRSRKEIPVSVKVSKSELHSTTYLLIMTSV
ncbi:piggyBac transposable element-derived protein 4-like [Parasteatoda tepidariorum]|uniref:piggyBac transposable element-derived protein 4-like n=1 Tax=Parasteatoda tepidariorum TaxID=114398 RepID=UPI001C7185F7|nr:piggyBac transposable element-derived protein 4-like [Parasteatoda tepidariorum]